MNLTESTEFNKSRALIEKKETNGTTQSGGAFGRTLCKRNSEGAICKKRKPKVFIFFFFLIDDQIKYWQYILKHIIIIVTHGCRY